MSSSTTYYKLVDRSPVRCDEHERNGEEVIIADDQIGLYQVRTHFAGSIDTPGEMPFKTVTTAKGGVAAQFESPTWEHAEQRHRKELQRIEGLRDHLVEPADTPHSWDHKGFGAAR